MNTFIKAIRDLTHEMHYLADELRIKREREDAQEELRQKIASARLRLMAEPMDTSREGRRSA